MIDDPVIDAAPGANKHLARQLGLASATALVVAEVIGVGIFLTTAGMARSLGCRSGCSPSGW